MSRPPRPTYAAPPVTETVHTGSLRASWCPRCKAWSGLNGEVVLLVPSGVTVLTTWSRCSICAEEDPARD